MCVTNREQDCTNCQLVVFENALDFCRWLIRKDHDHYVVLAHNFRGYDSAFILQYCYSQGIKPEIVVTGRKVLSIAINDIRMIDSLNFFLAPLASLPKTFGIPQVHKGYFPFLFNIPEHQNYVGLMPPSEYFDADGMKEKNRESFLSWHAEHVNDTFNLQEELVKYCKQDVHILKLCCLTFRKLFLETTGVDPFSCITISQACNAVFRRNFLKPDSIELLPPQQNDRHSAIAMRYLKWYAFKENVEIQHARNGGEKKIGKFKVDGWYDDRHVVEFYGCVFHGHSTCIRQRDLLVPGRERITMDQAEQNTFERKRYLESKGFVLHEIYECEYNALLKSDLEMKAFVDAVEIADPLVPRNALYGGRTNAVRLFKEAGQGEKIVYNDIRSLYPYVMKTGHFPIGLHRRITENFSNVENYEGLIHCRIIPPKGLYLPLLPARINGKLVFPLCGTCALEHSQDSCPHTDHERALTGTWVLFEVKEALKLGYELDYIFEIWHYDRISVYDPETKEGGLFTDYINTFYRLKLQADGYPDGCSNKEAYVRDIYEKEGISLDPSAIVKNNGLRAIAKTCLNSMYGKLGQRANLTQTKYITEPCELYELLMDETVEVHDVDFVSEEMVRVGWSHLDDFVETPGNTNVVLAAYVTAHGRITLYKYLNQVESSLLYFDTDSCFFSWPQNSIATTNYLGGMVDEISKDYGEGSFVSKFVAAGPKNYAFEVRKPDGSAHTIVKVRGITLNYRAGDVINFAAVERLVKRIGPSSLVTSDPYKIVRSNHDVIYSKSQDKIYRMVYDKRIVIDGFDTIPYGFN